MSYQQVEVYRKQIRLFGIPVWTVVKTISQEKFYELVSAEVLKKMDQKFLEMDQKVADQVLKRINGQLSEVINERFGGKGKS